MTFHRTLLWLALVAVFLSGFALGHVHAEERRFDWKPSLVYGLSRIPDEWSTHRFLHNGSGCTEGTAAWLIGPHPSDAKIALSSVAADAAFLGYTYGLYRLGKALHHEAAFRRLTWGVTAGLASVEVGGAVRNLRIC